MVAGADGNESRLKPDGHNPASHPHDEERHRHGDANTRDKRIKQEAAGLPGLRELPCASDQVEGERQYGKGKPKRSKRRHQRQCSAMDSACISSFLEWCLSAGERKRSLSRLDVHCCASVPQLTLFN